ncbi:MAG: BamA/OMP85 family outer membrane protein [Bacteroidota bacterium]
MLYRIILVQFLTTFLWASGALAQSRPVPPTLNLDYTAPVSCVVEDIQIIGNKFLDKEAIVDLLEFRTGDMIQLPGAAITESIHRIWNQGLIKDIAVYASRTTEGRVVLTIKIAEYPKLSTYFFEGIQENEQKELLKELTLVKGKFATDTLIKETEKSIKDFFIEKGYLYTAATITAIPDPTHADNVQLKIEIDKGTCLSVHTIQFEGNQHISSDVLKGQMQHVRERPRFTLVKDMLQAICTLQPVRKKGVLWHPFNPKACWNYLRKHVILLPSKFDPVKFEEDKKRILSYYQTQGFSDVAFAEDPVVRQQDASLHILMKLEEGRQYYLGPIKWTGNYRYDDHTLQQRLNIRQGDVYNPLLLQTRLYNDPEGQDIASLYLDYGYSFFQVDPVEIGVEGNVINLEMRMQEGPQARINKIFIEGNRLTHDYVIRRELRTLPGDKFSRAKLKRSYRELAQLNVFDPAIAISPMPNFADRTVDIKYKVQERPKFEVKLSGGWGGELLGQLGLFTNNFSLGNLWRARAPIGGGQTLGLSAEANNQGYSNFSLQFEDPWLGGRKARYFHANLGRSAEEHRRSLGGDIGLGIKLTWPDDYAALKGRLAYYRHDYDNYDLLGNKQEKTGMLNDLSVNISLERDSTGPNPIYPKEGSRLELHANLTPPWSQLYGEQYRKLTESGQYGWKEYHQWMLDGSYFLRLLGDLVLNCRAHFGILGKFSSQKCIGPFERFVLGGGSGFPKRTIRGEEHISLRGYKDDYFAPKDDVTDYLGGVIYDKFVLEMRYPIISNYAVNTYLLAFAEGGNTWTQYEKYNPLDFKRSVGVGLRIYIPFIIGTTIGFDLGYGFDKELSDPERNNLTFHFSVGMGVR